MTIQIIMLILLLL